MVNSLPHPYACAFRSLIDCLRTDASGPGGVKVGKETQASGPTGAGRTDHARLRRLNQMPMTMVARAPGHRHLHARNRARSQPNLLTIEGSTAEQSKGATVLGRLADGASEVLRS